MKKFPLVIIVILIGGALAGLDYWFNFYGKEPILVEKIDLQTPPVQVDPPVMAGVQNPNDVEVEPVIPIPVFSGDFPALLQANAQVFPYTINAQQPVFDLFGVFDVNALPGVQILRYDMVPLNSEGLLKPMQIYEVRQENQGAGITFLSLKANLSDQINSSELNEIEADYASNALFYNPTVGSENAFLLAENGVVLGFVYPRASTETFDSIKELMRGMN